MLDNQLNTPSQSPTSILPLINPPPPAPTVGRPEISTEDREIPTPTYDRLIIEAAKLDAASKYKSKFDYKIFKNLEMRYADKPIRGGIVKSNPLKLVNSHSSCQQCLYAFEIDTYGRGCMHNCTYCYAKAELTVHGYWNNPAPVPVNINEIRKIFYTVFETSKKSKWRAIMEQKIPLRIGCMSDSFMWIDAKYKLSQELLKILNFYQYPYTIITRSDLIAHDSYIPLIDKNLGSVQFSLSSINDPLNKLLEPGAASAERRLQALEKLVKSGIWTAVRINPMFPNFPDGYYSNPNFKWEGQIPTLNYSTLDIVDAVADTGCTAIIAGFGRFSSFSINNMNRALNRELRVFFNRAQIYKSSRDYHFSEPEIRHYYELYKKRCKENAVEFTVCYIGNGESEFWKHQDLWSNKKDCCNIKGKVCSFKTDSRSIGFNERLKFISKNSYTPVDSERLHIALGVEDQKKFKREIISTKGGPSGETSV